MKPSKFVLLYVTSTSILSPLRSTVDDVAAFPAAVVAAAFVVAAAVEAALAVVAAALAVVAAAAALAVVVVPEEAPPHATRPAHIIVLIRIPVIFPVFHFSSPFCYIISVVNF